MELLEKTGADGVGIARGAIGNPWIFRQLKTGCNAGLNGRPTREEVLVTAYEHARLSADLKGERGIIEMRKHLCWYLHQIPGTKELKHGA